MSLPAIIADQMSLSVPYQIIIFSFVALIVGIAIGVLVAPFLARYFPSLLSLHDNLKRDQPDSRKAKKNGEPQAEPSAESSEEMIKDTIDSVLQSYMAKIENNSKSFESLVVLGQSQKETLPILRSNLNDIINQLSGISQVLGEMPGRVRDEMVSYKRQEEERKIIEEQRIKEEELQKSAELLNSKKQMSREGFLKRLEDFSERDALVKISTLTKGIADELRPLSNNSSQLEKNFLPYLRMASQVEKLRQKLERFDGSSYLALEEKEKEIEEEIGVLETSHESLSKYHSVAWFFDLLTEAAHHPSLRSKTEDLKRSLDLEEFEITPGTEPEPQDMDKIDVETTEGYGSRTIISEVLENGYKLKESGAILKKPRVKVRLEG